MLDVKAVGDAILVALQKHVRPVLQAMEAKFAALEQRLDALPVPADGKSVTVEDVAPLIAEQVAAAVAALPPPVDGKDADPAAIEAAVAQAVAALPAAKDGSSVTVEDVLPMITEQIAMAVAAIPPAPAGKDADPAVLEQAVAAAVAAIPPAPAGKSLTVDDVAPLLAELVKSEVAELPVPKDGTSVALADVTAFLEAIGAKWALDFERRAADVLQRAVDRMPAAKDGRDAFDLDDIDMTQSEDGRTVTLAFRRGADVREKSFTVPVFSERGIFRPENQYLKGDGVTFGGSYFIAQKDAPGKPEDGAGGWRLAVKRGRDGRDLTDPAHKAPEPVRLP